jgi:hypothetical protein
MGGGLVRKLIEHAAERVGGEGDDGEGSRTLFCVRGGCACLGGCVLRWGGGRF